LTRCKSLAKADLLFVDEAHHFYFAEKKNKKGLAMVEDIIQKAKVKKQVLLTGTPSEFILKKYYVICVPLNVVHDSGMISDFYVDIASSNYNFDFKDYDSNGDLVSPNNMFHTNETNKTLDNLIKEIVRYLNSIRGNDYTNLMPEWLPTLKRLKKTMLACKSRAQARQVQKYFEKIGVKSVVSISEDDNKSKEIKNFVDDNSILVLIVVGRGILGFNYTQLVNVVDMTMTYNIDRIYQLLCRVARKYKKVDSNGNATDEYDNSQKKLFFKLAPQMLTDYYQHIMTAVCMLAEEEFFMSFNGKNFKEMEIPVKRITNNKRKINIDNSKKRKSKSSKYPPIDMEGLPVFEFFKSIYHKKGELLSVYAKTTMNDIRSEFTKVKFPAKTFEECKADADSCSGAREWSLKFADSFLTARRNGWYEELSKNMPKAFQRTKEECITAAQTCATKSEFKLKFSSLYQIARRNKWIEDCCSHFISKKRITTKEECLAISSQYRVKSHWKIGHGESYRFAEKNNWIEECCKHMEVMYVYHRTKEECLNIAKKYNIKKDFHKKENAIFLYAKRHGWLEECHRHMKIVDGRSTRHLI